MNEWGTLGRDLDLNLLRVFVAVAQEGSVTKAAGRLYLTQPAVSAALQRLARAIGAPLFARHGRGLVLSARGERLLRDAEPHLHALVAAALQAPAFAPATSERVIRLGLADVAETWLLPPLLRVLDREAPRMRLVVTPVQFRTVARALATSAVDLAVTVADELPAGATRKTLFQGGFVCLFDGRHVKAARRLSRETYLAHPHVVVSYNADLRGIVEDSLGIQRDVRVSVPTFHDVGALVLGTRLMATVPRLVGRDAVRRHPKLRALPLPFALGGAPMELCVRSGLADDDAVRFVAGHVERIAARAFAEA